MYIRRINSIQYVMVTGMELFLYQAEELAPRTPYTHDSEEDMSTTSSSKTHSSSSSTKQDYPPNFQPLAYIEFLLW